MSLELQALVADALFDGSDLLARTALLIRGETIEAILPERDLPSGLAVTDLGDAILAPGYVDLQVNGGGGVMFNDAPDLATLRRMAAAHAGLGATTILPTLITDTADRVAEAVQAVAAAVAQGVPGIAGLHLEGPHISLEKKGAHDPDLIRRMRDADLKQLLEAAAALPVLLVTLAPEAVSDAQIAALAAAGVVVSLGHSGAGFERCARAVESGARCVTHLFNAMSQLGSREPGLVGAALHQGALSAGLIADGIHVHPVSIARALAAKALPGRVFLVSDAMATAGSDMDRFLLNGREIRRRDGRLTLADGTLAGADLELSDAVARVAALGADRAGALAMATSIPAAVAGVGDRAGWLAPGRRADVICLSPEFRLRRVWRNGTLLS